METFREKISKLKQTEIDDSLNHGDIVYTTALSTYLGSDQVVKDSASASVEDIQYILLNVSDEWELLALGQNSTFLLRILQDQNILDDSTLHHLNRVVQNGGCYVSGTDFLNFLNITQQNMEKTYSSLSHKSDSLPQTYINPPQKYEKYLLASQQVLKELEKIRESHKDFKQVSLTTNQMIAIVNAIDAYEAFYHSSDELKEVKKIFKSLLGNNKLTSAKSL